MTISVPTETLHIYTRVSTERQKTDGTSLETQLELGTKRSQDLHFMLKHWNEGGASSHHESLDARPVLSELLSEINAEQIKHLWVYDQSRLSRNDFVASAIRYACQKHGVTLYTKDGVFDLSNPSDMLLKQIMDAMAGHENSVRMERSRLGKLNKVRMGLWHGGPPPYGYTIVDRKLAVIENESKWVKRIFKEIIKKTSIAKIKLLLEENGALPRRKGIWNLGSINALIANTHYDGFYQYTDKKSAQTVKVDCPRVIDNLTWVSAQQVRASSAKRQLQKNATTKHFYLLRDFLYCGHCGRAISGRKTNGAVSLYYCPNKESEWRKNGGSKTPWQRGTGCGFTRSMNIEQTEKVVWDFIKSVHSNSSHLKEDVKNRVLKVHGLTTSSAAHIKKIESQLKKLQREHVKLSEAYGNAEANHLMKKVSADVYKIMIKRLKEELEKLDERITIARTELKKGSEAHKWVSWLKDFGAEIEKLDRLSDQDKFNYLAGLIKRIDVRCNDATKEHELTVQLQMPIINDGIKYTGKIKDGRKEYLILDGIDYARVTVKKKDGRGWR